MGINSPVNGRWVNSQDKVYKSIFTEKNIRVNTAKEKEKAKDHWHILMAVNMKEISRMIMHMDLDWWNMAMEKAMKESGKIPKEKEEEHIDFQMAVDMRAIGSMEKNQV